MLVKWYKGTVALVVLGLVVIGLALSLRAGDSASTGWAMAPWQKHGIIFRHAPGGHDYR